MVLGHRTWLHLSLDSRPVIQNDPAFPEIPSKASPELRTTASSKAEVATARPCESQRLGRTGYPDSGAKVHKTSH